MATKEARRIKGTGGLYQRASDRMWVAAVELPPTGGKRRRKVVVRARKEAAIAEHRRLLKELAVHGDLRGASPAFTTWADDWMERYGKKRKPTNWRRDRSTIDRYLIPTLGRVKLDKLTVRHVHEMHAYVTRPKPEGLDLSPTTANLAHRLLATMLEAAYAEEKVPRNVAHVAGAPSVAVTQKEYLSSDQVRRLLLSLDPGDGTVSVDLALMALAYFTGMRPAERLGLTRDMIDLEAGTITVAWQLQRIAFDHGCGKPSAAGAWPCGKRKGGYCPKKQSVVPRNVEARLVEGGLWLTRPKTKHGWRQIPMPGILTAVLRAYLEQNEPGMAGLVFTRPRGGKGKGALDGRPIDLAVYTDRWHELIAAADLPRVKPHSARDSANTILTELGVPVDVRIKIVGHASAASNTVYTHTSDSRVAAGMDSLNRELDWRQD